MADDTPSRADLLSFMERLERAQTAFVAVADRILGVLEVHNEKLDAILAAATDEPGPSPVAEALEAIAASLNRQEGLLLAIPQSLAEAVRIELQRELVEEVEAEGEGAFEEAEPGVGFGDDADHEPHH